MLTKVIPSKRLNQWGGAAFVLGNTLFLANKFDEMSRLFLGRWMPDVISGENPVLILVGQVALTIGYIAYYQCYAQFVGSAGKQALRLFSGGGLTLAFGHFSFMSVLVDALPAVEYLFLLVALGVLFSLIGLIWFGLLNLRQPLLGHWFWLPLVTGLLGFTGFVFLRGQEITTIFLLFRTLFALGLIGLGILLWRKKPVLVVAI